MLKHIRNFFSFNTITQPPSGGCVLKHPFMAGAFHGSGPAAFRRLCVETVSDNSYRKFQTEPAAFRRLCVETLFHCVNMAGESPGAFRRLCVETVTDESTERHDEPAAFRRLCVETVISPDCFALY